jgi:hypothetical protein
MINCKRNDSTTNIYRESSDSRDESHLNNNISILAFDDGSGTRNPSSSLVSVNNDSQSICTGNALQVLSHIPLSQPALSSSDNAMLALFASEDVGATRLHDFVTINNTMQMMNNSYVFRRDLTSRSAPGYETRFSMENRSFHDGAPQRTDMNIDNYYNLESLQDVMDEAIDIAQSTISIMESIFPDNENTIQQPERKRRKINNKKLASGFSFIDRQ